VVQRWVGCKHGEHTSSLSATNASTWRSSESAWRWFSSSSGRQQSTVPRGDLCSTIQPANGGTSPADARARHNCRQHADAIEADFGAWRDFYWRDEQTTSNLSGVCRDSASRVCALCESRRREPKPRSQHMGWSECRGRCLSSKSRNGLLSGLVRLRQRFTCNSTFNGRDRE